MGLPEHTRAAVVIVAAGRGQRAGGHVAKQWQPLAGARVIDHTLHVFRTHPLIGRIVIVLHPEDLDQRFDGADTVAGGATRALSVRAGLEALADAPPQHVLIHDVARPCLSGALISRVIAALVEAAGSAPALPVSDALWTGAAGRVTGTQNRQGLYRAQTPQGFHFAPILAAHRIATPDAADDVAVARAAGLDVAIVEGSEDNLKITYPPDFERATRILETLDGYQARKRI